MKIQTRREFIKTTTGVLSACALGEYALSCAKKEEKPVWKMNLSICNESMREWDFAKQCAFAGQAGYTGIEIASFTLADSVELISQSERADMRKAMKDAGIQCVGLHWLLAPPPVGLHATTPDDAVRNRTWEYFDKLIDFCADLEGMVMIFGSPKQRNSIGITKAEATKHLADGFANAADHSQERGVKVLLEPLSSDQTDVVNTMAEAMEVVEIVNHPAIQTMFDFHNTADETEAFDVLIRKYFKYIHHIHVQEMDGKHLGTGTGGTDFIPAFRVLKELGYDKWVSLEVFDFSPGPEKIGNESMKVLKEIEASI